MTNYNEYLKILKKALQQVQNVCKSVKQMKAE